MRALVVRLSGAKDPSELFLADPTAFRAAFQAALDRSVPLGQVAAETSSSDLRGLALTDLGNAERLVREFGTDMRYCYEYRLWLIWNEVRWRSDAAAAERMAKRAAKAIYQEAAQEQDSTAKKALVSHAARTESCSRISAILQLARSEPGMQVAPDELDAHDWLLNVVNGTLDLRSGQLLPHRREDLITKLAPVEYDPDATCPRWTALVEYIMGGKAALVSFLKRAVGYCLTGVTSERCLFILYGLGKNGKTVFLEGLRMVFGDDYAARTPAQTLLVKSRDAIPNDVARLRGIRFVTASETDDGKKLAEAVVKELTGGDRLVARFMRAEFFEFSPKFKIFLATNHKPDISGTDDAVWDRIKLVPFTVRIPDDMQRPMDDLLAEFREELPGILNWAVEGCLEWQQQGLGSPDEVTRATAEYRQEQDLLGEFLHSMCVEVPKVREQASVIYRAYRNWAEQNGELPRTQKHFGTRLRERGFKRVKSGVWYWEGIGLKVEKKGKEPEKSDPGPMGPSGPIPPDNRSDPAGSDANPNQGATRAQGPSTDTAAGLFNG